MKNKILFLLILFALQSCSTSSYFLKDVYGRRYLADMKFKKRFTPDMGDCIADDAVYILQREPSKNVPAYVVLRFFKGGQFITSLFDAYPTAATVNDLSKGQVIGYYNCRKGKIITEEPNVSFNNSGRRVLHYFEVHSDSLVQIRTPFKGGRIFKKTALPGLNDTPVKPTW